MGSVKSLQDEITALGNSDEHQSQRYHSRISDTHKYVCMTVPKIACSRVKLTLYLLEGGDEPESQGDIHSEVALCASWISRPSQTWPDCPYSFSRPDVLESRSHVWLSSSRSAHRYTGGRTISGSATHDSGTLAKRDPHR